MSASDQEQGENAKKVCKDEIGKTGQLYLVV